MEHLVCDKVTKPLPIFSHVTIHNGIANISCVQGFIPKTFEFPSTEAGPQARQVLENLQTILESSGMNLMRVLKITIFLVHTEDFPAINEAINEAFPVNPPARTAVVVAELPRHARVVIEAIAAA